MKSLYKIYLILFLSGLAVVILLSRCSDTELPSEPEITMTDPVEPVDPVDPVDPDEPPEPSDQNNDGFLEWTMQDTLRTEGSLYGSENSKNIDLNFDDIDDIVIVLFTADKSALRTSSVKPLHDGISFPAIEYQDTLFTCESPLDGFTRTYNSSQFYNCDTTTHTQNLINITDRAKVESFIDLDSTTFNDLSFKSDSIEMYYSSYIYRSNFVDEFQRGDFLELGDRYIYFNILHENEIKKAYLKVRVESYRVIFLEKGIQK